MAAPVEHKVAIVHDWLTNQGGGERVTWALHKAYPNAPIFTSVYNKSALPQFQKLDIRTSFLQRIPLAIKKHQLFPTFRTVAFESFDLSEYDVIISSCSAESKGVITKPDALHVCYLHTPTRYYWDDHITYIKNARFFGPLNPIIRAISPFITEKMRLWDFAAAQRVDQFVANSAYVAQRTKKYYRRDATVIHPPIDASRFKIMDGPKRGFIVVSRLIPYKRVDLAVQACTKLALPLTVVGDGGELESLKAMAGPSVKFVGRLSDEDVARELAESSAFIFTAEEDFGLTPLEAMACGRPVIAFGKGGATETVVAGKTGLFFDEQTVDSLVAALESFNPDDFNPRAIRTYAEGFDEAVFIGKIRTFVDTNASSLKTKKLQA